MNTVKKQEEYIMCRGFVMYCILSDSTMRVCFVCERCCSHEIQCTTGFYLPPVSNTEPRSMPQKHEENTENNGFRTVSSPKRFY